MIAKEYYDAYLKKPDEGTCANCGKPTRLLNNTLGYLKYCCFRCSCEYIKKETIKKQQKQLENRKGKYTCAICGFKTDVIGVHIKQTHKMDCKDYYDKYLRKPGEGICPTCGKETTFIGITKGGYITHCSRSCAQNDKEVLKKKEETSMREHGVLHYRNCEQARKTFLENHTQEEIDKLYKNTIKTRDNVSDKVKEERVNKARKTREDRYGKGAWISDATIEQTKQTKKDRYGDENYNNREQATKTYIENFGQTYPIQHKYKYNDLYFDSSWEIAYYIWLSDNKITFEYHPSIKKTNLYYEWNGKRKSYYVDFIVEGQYVEIKNDLLYEKLLIPNTKDNEKYKLMIKNNVIILKYKEILPILKYIDEKYGKNYLKQFITSNVKL